VKKDKEKKKEGWQGQEEGGVQEALEEAVVDRRREGVKR
jgi:hypothetical protein